MHTSKFASFMMLKIVVYIGSDCIENVFRLVGLGCRRGPSNVDVCSDGGVWGVVARCGVRGEQNVKWSCCGVGVEMECYRSDVDTLRYHSRLTLSLDPCQVTSPFYAF